VARTGTASDTEHDVWAVEVSGDNHRSIQSIFLRRLATTWVTVATVCLLVIVLVCVHLRRVSERDAALRHGRLVAAVIEPGRGGDLSDSVARIQSRYDELVAVGTIGVAGEVRDVHPGRKAYRRAMTEAVETLIPDPRSQAEPPKTYTTQVTTPGSRDSVRVTAVLATVADDHAPSAQRLVIMSAPARGVRTVYFAIMLLWPIGVATVMMFASIYTWFDASLSRPLRELALALEEPSNESGHRKRVAVRGGRELVQIATRADDLIREVAETHKRQDRFEQRAKERIEDRVARVDQQLRRAEDRAMTDPMTHLKNRAHLEAELEAIFRRHRDADREVCAVMLDLDNFKRHNDRYGHQAGDALLAFTGSLLIGTTRAEDVAIRYGGDEFLLILPDVSAAEAARVAERIIKLFAQHARQFHDRPPVSMSAGVASARADRAASGHELVAKADRALYKAKHRGKNDVATFSAA